MAWAVCALVSLGQLFASPPLAIGEVPPLPKGEGVVGACSPNKPTYFSNTSFFVCVNSLELSV